MGVFSRGSPKQKKQSNALSDDGNNNTNGSSSSNNANRNNNNADAHSNRGGAREESQSRYQTLPEANISSHPSNNNSNNNNSNHKFSTKYKGFNTSITHIFQNPENARSDCCSLACCGILQSDYNRYILHNRRPPTFRNRIIQYVIIPIALFCAAGYAAVRIMDRNVKEVFVYMFLTMMFGWILGGCFRATYKHSLVRRDLLRKVRGMSSGLVIDSQDELDLDQTESEITCVHRMCGFYRTDLPNDEIYGSTTANDDTQDGTTNTNTNDFFGRVNWFFSSLFCGRLFKCHWQICGICAVAQEARQIDALVPLDRRRIDYVTFQSYFDYMNDFRKLRADQNGNLWNHFTAISKLSRMMIKTLLFVTMILLVFSVAVAPAKFQWPNVVVFIATFFQAFAILYFVHWHWNRFDLSLDAVIKYFACGFVITTTTAICFEMLESAFLNIILKYLMIVLNINIEVENNDDGYGSGNINFFDPVLYSTVAERKKAFQRQYPFLALIFLFCSAYIIAALVEETSKYFGFKMVEHPDFVADADLQKAVALGVFDQDDDEEEDRFECGGGLDCVDIDFEDEKDDPMGDLEHPTRQTITSRFIDGDADGIHDTTTTGAHGNENTQNNDHQPEVKHEAYLYPCPPKTLNSTGAAITVAMVSVALGFACCENLIYIFLYSRGPLDTEIAVLISRSLFPVHPLCAAIQSIGVCKQQLENDKSIGVGRIIFPALMLHGSYDFSIMAFNLLTTLSEDEENDEEVLNIIVLIYGMCTFIASILFVIGGALYYRKESNAQKVRLEQIDAARNFVGVSA